MNFPFPFARNAQIIFSFPLFLSVCVFCFHFHFVCFVCQFRLELVVVAVVLFCVIELFSCLSWIRLSSLLLFNLFFLCPTKTMKSNEKIPKKTKKHMLRIWYLKWDFVESIIKRKLRENWTLVHVCLSI